jgi:hypothetical protein
MRFYPAEPDIATVFNRIQDGDIDLQPDFQRGEVWPVKKRQRLVDSVLRGWIIPPVLVISHGSSTQQVLDGQQRLASIRDFKLGEFPVDGSIDPVDSNIEQLHGLTYPELPPDVQKRFDKTTLRIFEVTDFSPEEPAEIFFRLNQPTALTAAEKRNAFFGPVRSQIKELVADCGHKLSQSEILGFSNSRMALDEVFGRLLRTLELGSLNRKVTAAEVDDMYRRQQPASSHHIRRIAAATDLLASIGRTVLTYHGPSAPRVRLNRATTHTWLLFFARFVAQPNIEQAALFLRYVEVARSALTGEWVDEDEIRTLSGNTEFPGSLAIFSDRVSSRINDASSVILRDMILWLLWLFYTDFTGERCIDPGFDLLESRLQSDSELATEANEMPLLRLAEELDWGAKL